MVEGEDEVGEGDRLVEMESGTADGGGAPGNDGRETSPSLGIRLVVMGAG